MFFALEMSYVQLKFAYEEYYIVWNVIVFIYLLKYLGGFPQSIERKKYCMQVIAGGLL